jgi:hypothetical protein
MTGTLDTLDMRDSMVVNIAYTYSDRIPVEIIESCPLDCLKGEHPMIDDDDVPVENDIFAKDQYGNEVLLSVDMDGCSLNSEVTIFSREGKAMLAVNDIVAAMERVALECQSDSADIGGLVADKIDFLKSYLNEELPSSHFISEAGELFEKATPGTGLNITYAGKGVLEDRDLIGLVSSYRDSIKDNTVEVSLTI